MANATVEVGFNGVTIWAGDDTSTEPVIVQPTAPSGLPWSDSSEALAWGKAHAALMFGPEIEPVVENPAVIEAPVEEVPAEEEAPVEEPAPVEEVPVAE